MQVPTYPDGRSAVARLGRRISRPVEPRARTTAASRALGSVLAPLVMVVAAIVLLAACTTTTTDGSGTDDELGGIELGPPTSPTATPTTLLEAAAVTLPEGFVLPDTRAVVLPPVLGRPQAEIDHSEPRLPVRGGGAELRGTVYGPDGPVGGAVVRLERFVGDDFGREDIATNDDGEWTATELIGGRYKVRAWARPDLATVEPQAVFVANKDGSATVDVTVDRFEGEQIQGALDAAEPAVGEVHPFRALVSKIEVTEDGLVGGVGLEGREVQLTVLGGIRVVGSTTAMTDAEGFVSFDLVCTVAGLHGVNIRSGDLTADVDLPECGEGVYDPAALPPDVSDFPVGSTFTVPSPGPYPAGTYVATTPGTCGTAFEMLVGDQWLPTTTRTRTLVLPSSMRNLAAVPGAPACTFRRTA